MSDYKMIMSDGRSYPVSRQQRNTILMKSKTTGGHFPYYELRDTDVVVFFKHISGFERCDCSLPINGVEEPVVFEDKDEDLSNSPTVDTNDQEIEERRRLVLEEMLEKSACQHDETALHFITTISSKGKETKRFFPVCTFCGQRLRFLKAEDLSDELKDSAVEWVEK